MTTASRILVLGAAGRFGHAAAEAFRNAGWKVAGLVRPGSADRIAAGTEPVEVDALDHAAVTAAARGRAGVPPAAHPPYTGGAGAPAPPPPFSLHPTPAPGAPA